MIYENTVEADVRMLYYVSYFIMTGIWKTNLFLALLCCVTFKTLDTYS